MVLTRRGFSQIAVAGLASRARALAARKVPIAVQLYSVRQIAEKDLAGVLAEVARLGFQGVEFAGYYGHSAEDVRKMLDANRLKVAGTHTGLDTLLGDNLQRTMDYNRTIGNKNLIVPGMPQKNRASIEAWKETAKLFNEIAAKAKGEGFDVGYHNHTVEFQKMDGQVPFDVFFGNTSKDVKVQLDVGHAQRAGADPLDVINRYRGRIISIHVKEFNPDRDDAPLGEGKVQWKQVFSGLESAGATEWYIVEEEAKSCQRYECIQGAIERLRKMGK
jgi:sugar phosphate isomerase/epimerase